MTLSASPVFPGPLSRFTPAGSPGITLPDCDLHIHTYHSACCADMVRQRPGPILELARRMNLRAIGFADHLWMNSAVPPDDWYRPQDQTRITRLHAELAGLSSGLRVLVGCEADTRAPGQFSITPDFAASLDYVLLACSHTHMRTVVPNPESLTLPRLTRLVLDLFRSAVTSGLATAIPHPLLPCGFVPQFDAMIASVSDAQFLDLFGVAAARGVALEITVAFLPTAKKPFSFETPVRLLSLAKQAGCKFTFGSDAHAPEDQKRLFELRRLVDTLALTPEDLAPLIR